MAFNFPPSPSNGDTYTANGFTYEWDGSKWIRKSPSTGAQGATGPTGAQGALATINSNTNNYVVTATGTANTLQGESNFTFDGSTLSLSGNLKLPDNTSGNANVYLGTGDDFFLNHNGTHSYIINNTGNLYIRDLNGDVHIPVSYTHLTLPTKRIV